MCRLEIRSFFGFRIARVSPTILFRFGVAKTSKAFRRDRCARMEGPLPVVHTRSHVGQCTHLQTSNGQASASTHAMQATGVVECAANREAMLFLKPRDEILALRKRRKAWATRRFSECLLGRCEKVAQPPRVGNSSCESPLKSVVPFDNVNAVLGVGLS